MTECIHWTVRVRQDRSIIIPLSLGAAWILPLVSGARNAGPAKAAADIVNVVPLKSGLGTMAVSSSTLLSKEKEEGTISLRRHMAQVARPVQF